jgi:kynurenine formamidase
MLAMNLPGTRVIDLTHPISPTMPVSVGLPRVALTRCLDQADGAPATVETLEFMLHSGTHVDAPFHFIPDGATIEELGPFALSGSAVVVDVPARGGWEEVTGKRLRVWEKETGESIGEGDIVLLRTGYGVRWAPLPEGERYMTAGWPYLGTTAIDLLLDRRIKAVGVECPDPDKTDQHDLASSTFETHRRLLGAGVLIIENLAHLDQIPLARVEFLGMALPIQGASGSPIRALALLSEGT